MRALFIHKKYKFTGVTLNGLKQIRRLSDGIIGGYIEKEENLSHEGSCWVDINAMVHEDAMVFGNAQVCDTAEVYGTAVVCGNAWVLHNAQVYGNAHVYDNGFVSGNAKVWGCGVVCGNALVHGNAQVYNDARVYDNSQVYGNARVSGNARVFGNAHVCGDAQISRLSELAVIFMSPYSIAVTPQNIVIGCQMRSRFGKDQWKAGVKDATKALVKQYAPYLKLLKKSIPRQKPIQAKG